MIENQFIHTNNFHSTYESYNFFKLKFDIHQKYALLFSLKLRFFIPSEDKKNYVHFLKRRYEYLLSQAFSKNDFFERKSEKYFELYSLIEESFEWRESKNFLLKLSKSYRSEPSYLNLLTLIKEISDSRKTHLFH